MRVNSKKSIFSIRSDSARKASRGLRMPCALSQRSRSAAANTEYCIYWRRSTHTHDQWFRVRAYEVQADICRLTCWSTDSALILNFRFDRRKSSLACWSLGTSFFASFCCEVQLLLWQLLVSFPLTTTQSWFLFSASRTFTTPWKGIGKPSWFFDVLYA